MSRIYTQACLISKPFFFFHDTPSPSRLAEASRGPGMGRDLPNADPDLWASRPRFFPGEILRHKLLMTSDRQSTPGRRDGCSTCPISFSLHGAQETCYPASQDAFQEGPGIAGPVACPGSPGKLIDKQSPGHSLGGGSGMEPPSSSLPGPKTSPSPLCTRPPPAGGSAVEGCSPAVFISGQSFS